MRLNEKAAKRMLRGLRWWDNRLPQKRLVQATVHGDDLAGGFAETVGHQQEAGFGPDLVAADVSRR
jgi:hypothetical protein